MVYDLEEKGSRLANDLMRHFGVTRPALLKCWEAAIRRAPSETLRELWEHLCELDFATKQMRWNVRPVIKNGPVSETDLDRALASVERVYDLSESLMRRLNELLAVG